MSTSAVQRIYGLQVMHNLLQHKAHTVRTLWLEQDSKNARVNELAELAGQAGIKVQKVQQSALKKLANGGFHQGVVADILPDNLLTQQQLQQSLSALPDNATLLLLDGVQDPHNLGACLRSAEAAGVSLVMIPRDRAADLTPVARRAASGAGELMLICRVTNVARAIRTCQQEGFWVVGTADAADQMFYDGDFSGKTLLIMGGESDGCGI